MAIWRRRRERSDGSQSGHSSHESHLLANIGSEFCKITNLWVVGLRVRVPIFASSVKALGRGKEENMLKLENTKSMIPMTSVLSLDLGYLKVKKTCYILVRLWSPTSNSLQRLQKI